MNFYDRLEKCLQPNIRIKKLEYAGHGTRYKESFYESFDDLSKDMYEQIKKELLGETSDTEYSLMGYSMGSISVIETLRRILQEAEIKNPIQIFLAAHEPFTKHELLHFQKEELDEYVKERTIRFGGIPKHLIGNRSFWRVYLPVYRADYAMIAKYRFEELDLESDVSAVVFYSEKDTCYTDMKEWKKFFTSECEFIEYEGNHFFINEHYLEIAEVIRKRLER